MRPTLAFLLALAQLAAPLGRAPPARAELIDGVAAVVNGHVITLSELESRLGPALPPADSTGEAKAQRHQLLLSAAKAAIDDRLLAAEAQASGLTPTDEEIDNAIQDVERANHIDEATLDQELVRQGLSKERYRQMLKAQLTKMKVVEYKVKNQVEVSDDEIKARYEAMAARLPPRLEVHARDIYLPAAGDRAAARAKLVAARARVAKGESFAKVAKELGGPLADSGGDLGWFGKGMMLPELEKVAFSLKPGTVSQVFEAGGGLHLLYVENTRESGGAKPLSEARTQIREQLLQEKLEKAGQAYLAGLRQIADIELMVP